MTANRAVWMAVVCTGRKTTGGEDPGAAGRPVLHAQRSDRLLPGGCSSGGGKGDGLGSGRGELEAGGTGVLGQCIQSSVVLRGFLEEADHPADPELLVGGEQLAARSTG